MLCVSGYDVPTVAHGASQPGARYQLSYSLKLKSAIAITVFNIPCSYRVNFIKQAISTIADSLEQTKICYVATMLANNVTSNNVTSMVMFRG